MRRAGIMAWNTVAFLLRLVILGPFGALYHIGEVAGDFGMWLGRYLPGIKPLPRLHEDGRDGNGRRG